MIKMIKNIKFNKNYLKKKRKLKISKMVIGVVAVFSVATSTLTGCINRKSNTTSSFNNSTPSYSYSYSSFDNPLNKIDSYEYSNDGVIVTDSSYNEFVNYLDNIDTTYTYENLYEINNALNNYEQVKNFKVDNHNSPIKNITVDELFSVVKSNNRKYLEQKKKEYVSDFYEEFSDGDLRKICGIIVETINCYIEKGKVSNQEEVKCILGDLKIFERTTLTNAYVTDDNALMISPSMINTLKIKSSSSNQDVFKDTISHEAMHMIQKGCVHNTVTYRIGNSFKFENLSINPLFWNWFYEGSAEKLSNNFTGDTPLVYNYYINYINSLSYSTILNDNNSVNELEETTLSNNLDSIFKYFGASNEESKKEVINMMFSLDIIEMDNEEFLNKLNLDKDSDEYIKVKRNIKTSVCESMTKYFYRSLSEKVKNSNVKLNDIYYLITVFETDLDSHLNYTSLDKYEDNKEFIKRYVEIQNNFFNYLTSDKRYSQQDLENLFDEYGTLNTNRDNNFNLNFLNNEKRQFIENFLSNISITRTEQVRDVLSKNQENMTK